jgi:hypothetical protein
MKNFKYYPAVHDVLYEVYSKSYTDDEIDVIVNSLPDHIQSEGMLWGWSDTVFRDMMYRHLEKNKDYV